MPTLLRIILLVGNIGFLISSCIVFIDLIFNSTTDPTKPFLVLIPLRNSGILIKKIRFFPFIRKQLLKHIIYYNFLKPLVIL
jgi:hypothetical protein